MEITSNDIERIWPTDDAVWITAKNGRTAKELFADYPALSRARPEQRDRYTISPFGIHWEEVDEDLSFEGFFSKKDTDFVDPSLSVSKEKRHLVQYMQYANLNTNL